MPFELQPSLHGRLLTLEPPARRDFGALYAAASDPLIWDQHPYNARWQRDVFARVFADGIASGGALAITDNDGGALIGTSRYGGFDVERPRPRPRGCTAGSSSTPGMPGMTSTCR